MCVFITVGDYDFDIMQPLGPAEVKMDIGRTPK